MESDDSITQWIEEIKQGNDDAAGALWDHYFSQLVRIAHERLRTERDRMTDGEDVALSALGSFFEAAKKGRFPDLRDREGLWRLLSKMTQRKAVEYVRHKRRLKRGAGRVQGESALDHGTAGQDGIQRVEADELTPDLALIVKEEFQRLLDQLDDELQSFALVKMQGYTNKEIASQRQCAVATVERRLNLIRKKWQREHDRDE